jgi:alcohol dehydrogenase class IV
MRDGLVRIDADLTDRLGRERAQLGAYLSAVGFASAGSGIHHKICHVLGGMFNLPHAEMHTVVLPFVVALNAPRGSETDIRLSRALDAESGVDGLVRLQRRLGAPQNLRDLGMPASGIEEAAAVALPLVPPNNPHPVSVEVLAGLIRAAWSGDDPTTWME